jgi:hypothetical protein
VESKLSPLCTSATEWPIVLAPGDYDDGEFDGMKIDSGNRSTRRKPALAPLCTTQIPLDQTRVWTRAAAMGSQRLTAWAMARPTSSATLVTDSETTRCHNSQESNIIFTALKPQNIDWIRKHDYCSLSTEKLYYLKALKLQIL